MCELYFQHSTTGSIGENNLLANILGQHIFASTFTRILWHSQRLLCCIGGMGRSGITVKMSALQHILYNWV